MPSTRTNIRKNDTVQVIAGRDKGKRGRVLEVDAKHGRLLVEHAQMVKKHVRPNPQRQIKGGIAEREGPLHLSNVMLVCPSCGPVRVAKQVEDDGRTNRVCRKCGNPLEKK